jgi:hypothetical protein
MVVTLGSLGTYSVFVIGIAPYFALYCFVLVRKPDGFHPE